MSIDNVTCGGCGCDIPDGASEAERAANFQRGYQDGRSDFFDSGVRRPMPDCPSYEGGYDQGYDESTAELAAALVGANIGEAAGAKLVQAGVDLEELEATIKAVNRYMVRMTGDSAWRDANDVFDFGATLFPADGLTIAEIDAMNDYFAFRSGQILREYHDDGGEIETLCFDNRGPAFVAGYGDIEESSPEFEAGFCAGEGLAYESPVYRRGFWQGQAA